MNASEYNRDFDFRLITTCKVNEDDLKAFDEAFGYDAATSIRWLIKKLIVIKHIIESGNTVEIEKIGQFSSYEEFREWIISRYSLSISKEVSEGEKYE